jgi:hypothetical protein
MKGYRTKKIALPGGRVIEIVYFSDGEDGDVAEAVVQDVPGPAEEIDLEYERDGQLNLHICPDCESDLVYPTSWEERRGEGWRIERRCPNCEWRSVGEFDHEDVERFDDALNDGTEDLLSTLRSFARSNMEADVERLIEAIQLDLIEPMDF